jgi:hypothetical protein
VREALPKITAEVRAGRLAASVAARRLLDLTTQEGDLQCTTSSNC